jgi:hypothetical protein
MAGSSFVCMSDEQLFKLPLQYFNIVFVSKVLIEGLAHTDPSLMCCETAASGPRAEALEQVHFESCRWMTSLEPHCTSQSLSQCRVGRSWDTNPNPGGGRHGLRRGRNGIGAVDPSSRARYTGRNMNIRYMYTNISLVTYLVYCVCTLAVQWESISKTCRRSRVQILFAPFWTLISIGMYWYVLVCTYKLVYTGMCLHVLVHTGKLQYVPVCTQAGTYCNIPVCTRTCKQIPVHTVTCQYVLVHASTYQYIPVHTLISDTVMPWYSASGYITVHGSTRKYPKVLYPWIRRY